MPKQVYKLNQFHGGLNNSFNSRDIRDNELARATDVSIDSIGKIYNAGSFIEHESTADGHMNGNTAFGVGVMGKGLFAYSSNSRMLALGTGEEDSDGALQMPTDYLLLHTDDDDNAFTIFQRFVGASETYLDWKKDGEDKSLDNDELSIYNINGNLRISDTSETYQATSPRFWGAIEPKWYGDTAGGGQAGVYLGNGPGYLQYYREDSNIKPCFPETLNGDGDDCVLNGIVCNTVNGDNMSLPIYGYAGEPNVQIGTSNPHAYEGLGNQNGNLRWGVALEFDENSNDSGSWMTDTNTRYKFYVSTVYDDGTQESLPQLLPLYSNVSSWTGDGGFQTRAATSEMYFTNGNTFSTIGALVSVGITPMVKFHGGTYDSPTNKDNFNFGSTDAEDATDTGNKRISGVRFYWASNEDGYTELWRMFDCDFSRGTRVYGLMSGQGGTNRIAWKRHRQPASVGNFTYNKPDFGDTNIFKHPPKLLSYYTANQHEPTDEITVKGFKTSVVLNNRTYIGNISKDVAVGSASGNHTKFQNRILRSPINQHDKFPDIPVNRIEAFNDAEEIIHLAAYSDRILQFTKDTMYILNATQDSEYLEATYNFKGVDSSASVVTTDIGIAWANKDGAYLYTGSKVVNLLEKDGQRVISLEEWDKIRYNLCVGYSAKYNQLLFKGRDISNSDSLTDLTTAVYVYDLTLQSWSHVPNAKIPTGVSGYDSIYSTNFVNDYNGDVIYYDYLTEKMYKWDGSAAGSGSLDVITKDIDFGQPSTRKKIYKVYVSYKGDGINVNVNYAVNGNTNSFGTDSDGQFYKIDEFGNSTKANEADNCLYSVSVGHEDWVRAELIPSESIKNIYSFQLRISGTPGDDFEIGDISIIYKTKKVK